MWLAWKATTNSSDREKGESVESVTCLVWKATANAIDHEKGDSVESDSRGNIL